MSEDNARKSPILWLALILLAACIAGTLVVVVIAAFQGAGELPAVYHTEGAGADRDLAGLAQAAQRDLHATLTVSGRTVAVDLSDRDGAIGAGVAVTLRLAHATLSGLDQTLQLQSRGDQFVGVLSRPLAAGYWLVELRPDASAWLLRGRVPAGGGVLRPGDR
jgi:hypothetical protein